MQQGRTRRVRRLVWLLVAVLALHVPGRVGADEEARPEIAQYPAENYDPGPGWPEGWTPPPPPTEMSERMKAEVERVLRERPDRYTRYE